MPGALFAPFRKRRDTGSTVLSTPAAPATPSTPSPADTATSYYTLLSWVSARATNFDVYLSTVNPPTTIVAPQIQATSYVPTLLPATTYYWKIAAFNSGGSATGPVWSFTTPAATAVIWSLAGTVVTSRVRFASATIQETLSASPNTASANFGTSAPTAGQAIKVGLGTLDNASLIFGGEIQDVDQTYVGTSDTGTLWPVAMVDQTFRLNKRRPFGTWTAVSASTIASYLVATFAPSDFTSAGVQGGLPTVTVNFDGSQDFMTCLRALATAISTSSSIGQAKVTYAKDAQLFLVNPDTVTPDAIDINHPPLSVPSPIRFATDISQVRTRVYGKGNPQTTPTDVLARETIVPLGDVSLFTATGGRAIAGTTPNGAQTDILTYAGVQLGGGGSLVGPGQSPSVAPTLVLAAGTAMGTGPYQYAYTDVTAAGESLPSPLATITTGVAAAPITGPLSNGQFVSGALVSGGTYSWALTWVTPIGETTPGPLFTLTLGAGEVGESLQQLPGSGAHAYNPIPASATSFNLYRTVSGGSQLKLVTNLPLTTFVYDDKVTADGSLGVNAPTVNTAFERAVSVSGISAGASPTTSRKVYRTAVGGAQLKLLTTIADNTTTTYADSIADGSLGANVPTSDTSGLTQPSGQVNAGSLTLLTASSAPFSANGGWAILSGGQTVRYTGVSTNTLTGIPASGAGAIATTVLYGSQILPAPALTGVNSGNGIVRAMAKGSTVAIWVQREDVSAQAALGALELDDNGVATDGIREYTITDGRMNEAGITALCDADLAQFSRPIVSATYYTRDIKTRAGRTVSINLLTGTFDPATFDHATFDIAYGYGNSGSFTIQSVALTFDVPTLCPLRQVQASSVSFTLQDLLRKVVLS